jgi:hypothetical protein
VLLLTLSLSCSKKDDPVLAVIGEIKGDVFIIKNGVKQKAEKGMKLFEGDEIITGKKSSVELSYKKNKITVFEKSKLAVKKLKYDNRTDEISSEFFLSEGRVSIDSSENIKQKNSISIITPDAVAESSDSNFSVSSIMGETKIESKKGNVDATSKKTGKKTMLTSGQKISETKNIIIQKPVKKIVPAEFSAVKPGVEVPKVK